MEAMLMTTGTKLAASTNESGCIAAIHFRDLEKDSRIAIAGVKAKLTKTSNQQGYHTHNEQDFLQKTKH